MKNNMLALFSFTYYDGINSTHQQSLEISLINC